MVGGVSWLKSLHIVGGARCCCCCCVEVEVVGVVAVSGVAVVMRFEMHSQQL